MTCELGRSGQLPAAVVVALHQPLNLAVLQAGFGAGRYRTPVGQGVLDLLLQYLSLCDLAGHQRAIGLAQYAENEAAGVSKPLGLQAVRRKVEPRGRIEHLHRLPEKGDALVYRLDLLFQFAAEGCQVLPLLGDADGDWVFKVGDRGHGIAFWASVALRQS